MVWSALYDTPRRAAAALRSCAGDAHDHLPAAVLEVSGDDRDLVRDAVAAFRSGRWNLDNVGLGFNLTVAVALGFIALAGVPPRRRRDVDLFRSRARRDEDEAQRRGPRLLHIALFFSDDDALHLATPTPYGYVGAVALTRL